LLHHVFGHGNGNGKADILRPLGLAKVTRVDADHFTTMIDQGAAAIAGVDGGVRGQPDKRPFQPAFNCWRL